MTIHDAVYVEAPDAEARRVRDLMKTQIEAATSDGFSLFSKQKGTSLPIRCAISSSPPTESRSTGSITGLCIRIIQ